MTQKTKKQCALKPVGHRVLLQYVEESKAGKEGGIILPDTAKKKPEAARVIALGSVKAYKDGTKEPWPFEVGDLVLINRYSAKEITYEDEEYIIVSADEIEAVLASE